MQEPITLAFAGDVMLGRLVNQAIAMKGTAHPWGNLLPVIRQADLFLINLECAITEHTERWQDSEGRYKAFYFRTDPANVETLTIGRVDFASLANNHIQDFGIQGLLDTVKHLDDAGIPHAGAGSDIESARAPARLAAGHWRINVAACADYPEEWAATSSRPGINFIPVTLDQDTLSEIQRQISVAREGADLVVFSIHWGPNMRPRPIDIFREFAHRVIESGADIFWGHSAHVVQGVEIWRDKLIMYDTGDFIDDYAVDVELRNDLSALFLARVRPPDVLDVELVPVHIRNMQVTLADAGEREWIMQRITNLCDELGTRPDVIPERYSLRIDCRAMSDER